MKVRIISQLELEGFAEAIKDADAEGGNFKPLSVAEIRERSMAARTVLETLKNATAQPQWFDQYHRLINAGLPWRVAAYIAWATMPKEHREPKTQDELAQKVLGLTSDRAIASWRKKYPGIDQLIADLQAESLMEYRPAAFRALGEMATKEHYRAAPDRKLFFEMTRDYTPRQKIESDNVIRRTDDMSNVSEADLLAMSGKQNTLKPATEDGDDE
jgi:hypothetical protein